MEELKIGDVVILKSGGPRMTIYNVLSNNVYCQWFKNEELIHGDFEKGVLELDN
ncbi:DUF2158 domain-containing protein [Kordia sp. YSTF-M3]|uniref:DUF2158 domain-containing protein n=1 Tax=Kordia aestuariivivens TaxID=2759037 RepID=A0ABR7Q940_9FLAO|nr:DUF2158 domain-containing protein [Kordia aestuariivivens]MBC8755008.1 DUF2158 domain-containing protein [Kordia aestuariivivens]